MFSLFVPLSLIFSNVDLYALHCLTIIPYVCMYDVIESLLHHIIPYVCMYDIIVSLLAPCYPVCVYVRCNGIPPRTMLSHSVYVRCNSIPTRTTLA